MILVTGATGTYQTAYGQNLRGGWFIPRADVAHRCFARSSNPKRSSKPSASPTNGLKNL